MRTTWLARVVCVTASILAASGAAAETSSISMTAGIGGLVKAGRWVPVQLSLALPGDLSDAELLVSWGTATVRRQLDLGGSSTRRLEIYIRTSETTGVITAQVRSSGQRSGSQIFAQGEATVRALAQADPIVVCVGATGPDCTATIPPERLPASPRGYEAVDRLIVSSDESLLLPEQREAIAAWRALQRLNEGGDLGLVNQPARPTLPRGLPAPILRSVAGLAVVYIGAMLVIGLAGPLPWRALRRRSLVLAAIIGTGSVGVLAIGAGLPRRPVVVHHASVVEQLPGSSSSLVSIRGIIEFPAVRTFGVRWPIADAMLQPAASGDRVEQAFDAAGHPTVTGRRGLGTRQAFAGEGVIPMHVLTVRTDGDAVTVSNDSAFDMTGCRFGTGFQPADAGALPRGASIAARQIGQPAGPVLTCTFDGILVPFEDTSTAVLSTGSTTVAVYR